MDSKPRFELLSDSDINVSTKKRPMIDLSKTKVGLISFIAICIIFIFNVIMVISVLSSSRKVSELDNKISELSLTYESNRQKNDNFKGQYDNQKLKNDNILASLSKLNDDLVSLRRENERLTTLENDFKKIIEDSGRPGDDIVIKKDIEKMKVIMEKSLYYRALKFYNPNGGNIQFFHDTVILSSQRELDFVEKVVKGKLQSLCFSTKRDSYDGEVFIQRCRDMAPTVVLIYLDNGAKFGGYTSKIWEQHHVKDDADSFMFNINDEVVFPINKQQWAVSTGGKGLPQFGYGDLKLMDDGTGRSSFPFTYGDPRDEGPNKLTKGVKVIKSYILEVFSINQS